MQFEYKEGSKTMLNNFQQDGFGALPSIISTKHIIMYSLLLYAVDRMTMNMSCISYTSIISLIAYLCFDQTSIDNALLMNLHNQVN